MKRGKLICLSGVDGAGKTTVAKELVKDFNESGKYCRYRYGRYEPFLLLPVMYIGKKIFFPHTDREKNYSGYATTKTQATRKHRFLSQLYQLLLFGEYYLQLVYRLSFPLVFRNGIVVCDRYVLDTIVTDLAVDFQYSFDDVKALYEKLQKIMFRPDIAILIDIPEEIAFSRKDDIPAIDYLKERRSLYRASGSEFGFTIVDGSVPFELQKNNLSRILEEYGCKKW